VGYEFLPDLAIADIAFRASGKSLEELFSSAADALLNVMIENLDQIEPREERSVQLKNSDLDMLLFDTLQELIYYKDTERLLLRLGPMQIRELDQVFQLKAQARGEVLNSDRHHQRADVKAVTLYRFNVTRKAGGWEATVVLDI
jgi:protein archease